MVDKSRMSCNRPQRTPDGPKKFVVKACKNGEERIVRFGDPKMSIKKNIPARKASFMARHNCSEKTDSFSPAYWSCKAWR